MISPFELSEDAQFAMRFVIDHQYIGNYYSFLLMDPYPELDRNLDYEQIETYTKYTSKGFGI